MWIAIAALNLTFAAILGAFGAHGLKSFATPEQHFSAYTATDYFFYHALGLLALGIMAKTLPRLPIRFSFICPRWNIFILRLALLNEYRHSSNLWCNYTIGGAFMILGWLVLKRNALDTLNSFPTFVK